jgi:hypothetical protein
MAPQLLSELARHIAMALAPVPDRPLSRPL